MHACMHACNSPHTTHTPKKITYTYIYTQIDTSRCINITYTARRKTPAAAAGAGGGAAAGTPAGLAAAVAATVYAGLGVGVWGLGFN